MIYYKDSARNTQACSLSIKILLSALFITIAPVTQAAINNHTSIRVNAHNSNDTAGFVVDPTDYCSDNIEAQTFHPKYQTSNQRAMDCMLTQIRGYQQVAMTKKQQYHAYKAQAWLSYAYHEDSIKSRTLAGTQALQAGAEILKTLESGTEKSFNIITDIPSSSALMRPDLWATLSALKNSGGINSAPRELALSEVALIWAAADQCKQGGRQSGSHFRMADRWLEQAREAYINSHDSQTNVALEKLTNHYFKQFAPLDPSDDRCQGQVLPLP